MYNMKITQLRANHITKPLGFQMNPLSLSWICENEEEEKTVVSARIRIFSDGQCCSDSGWLPHVDSADHHPERLPLVPRTRYEWTVEAISDTGSRAEASSWFETGKMKEPWQAEWISPRQSAEEISVPVLQRQFSLNEVSDEARLYICGLGLYEIRINGQKLGKEYLAPGYHSYDLHLQTYTYDPSALLRQGENTIQILLGDGWFKGRIGFNGGFTGVYGNRYYAICELYLHPSDCAPLLTTDLSWGWKPSPVISCSIYDGEVYDSAREAELKEKELWLPVEKTEPVHCGPLCDRWSLPVVAEESFPPVQLLRSPKGETILDFGQNLTGWVKIRNTLPDGAVIRLTAGEILQNECFYHENYREAKAAYEYRSNGIERTIRPHFTFYGFRYMLVEIEEADEEAVRRQLLPDNFIAVHLRSQMEQTGSIQTGNNLVNRLVENIVWSAKDNFLDVPMDCPQRDERLGWTGDAQVFSETACMIFYAPAFFRKYLWDMRAEQKLIGGAVPNVVPRLKKGMVAEYGTQPWADSGVLIPWYVYQAYGDKSLLGECYPGMRAWTEYLQELDQKAGNKHLLRDRFSFGDWLAMDNDAPGPFGKTDPVLISGTHYYQEAKIMSRAAAILGDPGESAHYKALSEEILEAIREEFFDHEGLCNQKTQTASALAIMFDLNPDEQSRQREGDALDKAVWDNHGFLNTGFIGTPLLLSALTETGHARTAAHLLLNQEMPGWLYEVKMGATTIWERWNSVLPDGSMNPDGMNSLNHYSYGSIAAWMYRYAAGIRAMSPGYHRVHIVPHVIPELKFVNCRMQTAAGVYRVQWRVTEENEVKFEADVPMGAQADFCYSTYQAVLPAGHTCISLALDEGERL